MTDRELLELAAKAAGIEHGADRTECGLSLTENGRHRSLPQWNPLTDDGDALRLAVKLGMIVSVCDHPDLLEVEASVFPAGRPSLLMFREGYTTDPYSATRRAIVRAAAEIGSSM